VDTLNLEDDAVDRSLREMVEHLRGLRRYLSGRRASA
jgi:hypothetical protein